MEGGVIEFELRSLPGVIAASVEAGAVSLLVLPDVDSDALQVVAAAVLATHGLDASIRVLGGMASPSAGTDRAKRVAVGAVGSIALIGMAAGAGVAAVTGALPVGFHARPHAEARLAVGTEHRPAVSRHSTSGITVVPGSQPDWAADQGSWPLPAALPPAPVTVPPAVITSQVVAAPHVADVDPPIDKTIRPSPVAGPTIPAVVAPHLDANVPSPDVGDDNDDGTGAADDDHGDHGRGDDRRHFGWENGPAHASDRSSAADAPRRGHR